MSSVINPYTRPEMRRKTYRTLSLICEDEALSDVQLKAYQSKLNQYQSFLESVNRLALCGNVCVTEETVTIGEHGLLTGESLNALQHAGAISVYNTLQQNNWEFPISEDGEVAVIKTHIPVPDEFLDSEKPIRSDWPAVHISECFVEAERAKLHGSVLPLRTFLPPTVIFRNAADVEEDVPEPELNIPNTTAMAGDGSVELIPSSKGGISVKKMKKDGKEELVPLEDYYFGRQDGNTEYLEEKGDFRFKCAVCQRMFYSNVKLMSHILSHVDEVSQAGLDSDSNQCTICSSVFHSPFELRIHMDHTHTVTEDESVQRGSHPVQRKPAISGSNVMVSGVIAQDGHLVNNGTVFGLSCRICDKEAATELVLAHHLQSSHRQREMPYVCRLCLFRSSLYEDILDHFKKVHDNSNHLLCTYCLRIFTPSDARTPAYPGGPMGAAILTGGVGQTQVYLQHLRMHQVRHQIRRCPTCRLNFTNKSDYQVHRRLDHKASRTGGTDKQSLSDSVTVDGAPDERTPVAEPRPDVTAIRAPPVITSIDEYELLDLGDNYQTTVASSEPTARLLVSRQTMDGQQPRVTLMNAPEASRMKSLTSLRIPTDVENLNCLECGIALGSAEHKHYMPCSLCRFATYCAVAYARHLEGMHLLTSGQANGDAEIDTPMVQPVFFSWAMPEKLIELELPEVTQGQPCEPHQVPVTEVSENVPMEVTPSEDLIRQKLSADLAPGLDNELEQSNTPVVNEQANGNAVLEQNRTSHDESGEQQNNERAEIRTIITMQTPVSNSQPDEPTEVGDVVDEDKHLVYLSTYMNAHVPAYSFFCLHCGITGLNSNELARHLVEVCGTDSATLNPPAAILQTHKEAEAAGKNMENETAEIEEPETAEAARAVPPQEAMDVLFTSVAQFDHADQLPTSETDATVSGPAASNDVNMGSEQQPPTAFGTTGETQAGEQLPAEALMPGANQFISRVSEDGTTTIDVTDASGQVVQQFILPEDLQLEEGQTLVMIQGEDGQPQLAIVNQEDFIDTPSDQLAVQSDEQTDNLLLYSQTDDAQPQVPPDALGEREEEKENRQYLV